MVIKIRKLCIFYLKREKMLRNTNSAFGGDRRRVDWEHVWC